MSLHPCLRVVRSAVAQTRKKDSRVTMSPPELPPEIVTPYSRPCCADVTDLAYTSSHAVQPHAPMRLRRVRTEWIGQ
jgi:hypothetical protein